jgi:hypothetical protein
LKAAIESYHKVEPLLKYFEAVSINVPLGQGPPQVNRCITSDWQHLILMNEKLGELMMQVESISKDGSIDLIDGINTQYDDFEKVLKNSEYLADITEDLIYQAYRSAIQFDHSRGFDDFTQYH